MLPIPANVRFDLYRSGFSPPDAEATDVPGYLEAAYDEGLRVVDAAGAFRFTHRLSVDDSVLVVDDFDAFTASGLRDVIYVGTTAFEVVYVEPAGGFSRVFLNRRLPNWPTNDL